MSLWVDSRRQFTVAAWLRQTQCPKREHYWPSQVKSKMGSKASKDTELSLSKFCENGGKWSSESIVMLEEGDNVIGAECGPCTVDKLNLVCPEWEGEEWTGLIVSCVIAWFLVFCLLLIVLKMWSEFLPRLIWNSRVQISIKTNSTFSFGQFQTCSPQTKSIHASYSYRYIRWCEEQKKILKFLS
jgi:hypothetical protein